MTPGRKFSTTTSALSIRDRAVARSSGCFKPRVMLRLPRFQVALAGVCHFGPPGGSTRMTSAPWSASNIPARGPAMYCPKSITRMCCSTPAMGDLRHCEQAMALQVQRRLALPPGGVNRLAPWPRHPRGGLLHHRHSHENRVFTPSYLALLRPGKRKDPLVFMGMTGRRTPKLTRYVWLTIMGTVHSSSGSLPRRRKP